MRNRLAVTIALFFTALIICAGCEGSQHATPAEIRESSTSTEENTASGAGHDGSEAVEEDEDKPIPDSETTQQAVPPSSQDFDQEREREIVLVSAEDFYFNGHVILVRESPGEMFRVSWEEGELPPDYPVREKYAILGQGIKDYDDGREYYELLNNRYYTTYEPDDKSILDRDDAQECIRAYFSRNVVFIAAAQNRVLCLSPGIIPQEIRYNPAASRLYEIVEDGEIIHTLLTADYHSQRAMFLPFYNVSYVFLGMSNTSNNDYFSLETGVIGPSPLQTYHLGHEISENPEGSKFAILESGRGSLHRLQQLSIYSLPDFHLLKSIPLGEANTYPLYSSVQFLENGIVAFSESHGQGIPKTYFIDIETQEKTFIIKSLRGMVFSPDGRYVAYDVREDRQIEMSDHEDRETSNRLQGYYILDLETNQAVFYETKSENNGVICWSQRAVVDELINQGVLD